MLLIMLMLIENKGRVDQLDFASRLHNWMCHGFTEFGDLGTYRPSSYALYRMQEPLSVQLLLGIEKKVPIRSLFQGHCWDHNSALKKVY